MKIAFVIAYESTPYAGVVRPFINWAKELLRHDVETELLLYDIGDLVKTTIEKLGLKFKAFSTVKQLVEHIMATSYDYILIDDYIKRLQLLNRIKTMASKIVYAQVLYGVHSISPVFKPISIREKILDYTAKFIPFQVFRRKYLRLIRYAEMVIANSGTTATLLNVFYGIETNGIVYPPVDTEIFKPIIKRKKRQVILYLGSLFGDTEVELVKDLCKLLDSTAIDVIALGNKTLGETLSKVCNLRMVSGIPDEDLAKIYSESLITICPQRWEQFGYVVAESIASGTPVLAFNIMGPGEIVALTGCGIAVNHRRELLEVLTKILNNEDDYFKMIIKCKNKDLTNSPFAANVSTRELLNILRKFQRSRKLNN